jgi:excisionase family DNA binding protein
MPKLDEYLTVKEAAEYLGVAKNTMRNWDAAGKIPVHRHPVNNYRLYKLSDLDDVLKRTERSRTRLRRKPRWLPDELGQNTKPDSESIRDANCD